MFEMDARLQFSIAVMCAHPSSQIKLLHDRASSRLAVTVLSATGVPPRDDGQARNLYIKIYFLPDRTYGACTIK